MKRRPVPLRSAIGVVVAAAAIVGCVSTNEVGGTANATPTTVAPTVESGSLGTGIDHEGATVTVFAIRAFDQSVNRVARIEAVVRSENESDGIRRNPDLRLICDETENAGDWFLGSTWEPNAVLPVNAVAEGEVIIGFPAKGKTPEYSVVDCTNARLRVTVTSPRNPLPRVVEIAIDASVIDEAARRPRGANLPLPRATS